VIERPLSGRYDGAVLSLLRQNGSMSRSAISAVTGLSATTITKVVAPLLERGYIEEMGAETAARVGRPAIGIRLVPSATAVLAVQIGIGFVRAALVDPLARLLSLTEFEFDRDESADDVLEKIAERVRSELIGTGPTVLGVGVAAPGVVGADGRVNTLSINLGWRDVPVADIFERCIGLPTVVEHHVSAMALAENRFGLNASNLAFVYLQMGVGLGIVLHDAPFVGGRHGVSELGHIHVVDNGELCACGAHGCLETVASESALARELARIGIAVSPDTSALAEVERLSPARADVAAIRARLLEVLSTGIASVANLFSPDVIILGGLFSDLAAASIAELREGVRAEVFPLLRDALRLEPSSFGTDAGVVGAATVALEAFFYGVGTL
jgi:predicted NBD/HSP70 family sugar kinase